MWQVASVRRKSRQFDGRPTAYVLLRCKRKAGDSDVFMFLMWVHIGGLTFYSDWIILTFDLVQLVVLRISSVFVGFEEAQALPFWCCCAVISHAIALSN